MKTLAKPLSKRIKHDFSRYAITQRLLVGVGQTSHQITSRMTMWSSGYRVRSITPLADDKAMKTGAEFVGESFILLVSGGIIVWEYNRSNNEKKAKDIASKAKIKQEKQELNDKINDLETRLHQLEATVSLSKDKVGLSGVAVSSLPTKQSSWGWFGYSSGSASGSPSGSSGDSA